MATVTDSARLDLGGNLRHGDIHTWAPNLWRYLVERFGVNSVLDVGCGEGHAVKFFHDMGLYAYGVEGLLTNVKNAVAPIALHDLLNGPFILPVDLVWSCEVAEHIDQTLVDNYVGTLANGRVVAMTHAVPGQAGYHHVNCQPAEYWIGKMLSRGFTLSEDNAILREISTREQTWNYYAKSGLVFVRN